jgi:diadenosine tetraphosphatase ApaH/serine/threonine PP2A family protein phosphatase
MTPTVALLYDVHGNLPALEAVLEDAVSAGATSGVFGGDAASFGAWPAETVEALLTCPVPLVWLRGNWDRWLASFPPADLPANPVVPGAAHFALARLDGATVARLGALPTEVVLGSTRCVHAGPGNDMAGIPAETDEGEAERLATVLEERLVTGHTHVQFVRRGRAGDREIEIVNPGSVGLPFDGDPRAAYALLRPGGVELRRVAYDHARAARAVRDIGEQWAETVAGWVERSHP